MDHTRRHFLAATTATLITTKLRAQATHIDLAAIERERTLAEVAALPPSTTNPTDICRAAATLTAAFLITKDPTYATRATGHLQAIIRTTPEPTVPVTTLLPLAEAAVALRFLTDAFDPTPVHAWFATLQTFMDTDRAMIIQRDVHDHRASAHLLIASAIARSQPVTDPLGSKALAACRARLRKPTLRNQITSDGRFPQELATPIPYRNTLFNFDLLAGACQILDSPFEKLWDYELPDGPGLRSVAAFLFPMIQDPRKWIAVADTDHFRDLPGRRPALLFAGRAYNRPDYVDLWRSTPPIIDPALADTFPIRQPILWTTRAPHGM